MKESATSKTKKLHLNIPDGIHRRMRVKCALENCTMQDFVSKLIAESVKDVTLPVTDKKAAREYL